MRARRLLTVVAVAMIMALVLTAAGCGFGDRDGESSGELVIYSARNEVFVKPLIEEFEKETGIRVRLLSGREELVNRIMEEKNNVQADIFLSNDAGAMEYLRRAGLLRPNDSAALAVIDEKFRAPDGAWVGLTARSRILMYNRDLISAEEMPQTLRELADPRWRGQFMITRGGNSSFITHVAALRAVWGDEETLEWLRAVRENAGAVVSGHTDIRKAVGAGEFKFGLVNNYYYHLQLAEERDNNVGAIYPDQGEGGMGVFVNVAGVAMLKGGPNPDNARLFIDWLLEPEQQAAFASLSMETPLRADIKAVEGVRRIDQYKVMDIPLSSLGEFWADAMALIEESGLDVNL